MPGYKCIGGHDKCDEMYAGPDCPYCEEHTDAVTEAVIDDLNSRTTRGVNKYQTTLEKNPLSHVEILQHAYEEALDLAQYLKKAMMEIENVETAGLRAPEVPEQRKEQTSYCGRGSRC